MGNGGGSGKWNKEGSAQGLIDETGCVWLKQKAKKEGKYKKRVWAEDIGVKKGLVE